MGQQSRRVKRIEEIRRLANRIEKNACKKCRKAGRAKSGTKHLTCGAALDAAQTAWSHAPIKTAPIPVETPSAPIRWGSLSDEVTEYGRRSEWNEQITSGVQQALTSLEYEAALIRAIQRDQRLNPAELDAALSVVDAGGTPWGHA